jgi:hypothetical protein
MREIDLNQIPESPDMFRSDHLFSYFFYPKEAVMSGNIEYPYSVRTKEGGLVQGYDDPSMAAENAKQRNNRAEKLEIKTRYEGTNIPAPRGKQ